MHKDIIKTLIIRDLEKLKTEISLYKSEDNLWITDGLITNSAGNLCLHLIGNLNTYIGSALGKRNYIRNRDLEFSDINIPIETLKKEIEKTKNVINETFEMLEEENLKEIYPFGVSVGQTTIAYYLTHLCVHLGYHLGQINYHRRLFDSQ